MIDNEHVSDVFCTLCRESVVLETANEKGMGWSVAADVLCRASTGRALANVLELTE